MQLPLHLASFLLTLEFLQYGHHDDVFEKLLLVISFGSKAIPLPGRRWMDLPLRHCNCVPKPIQYCPLILGLGK